MSKVCYLGFLITREGLRPDLNKTRTIAELAAPGSKDKVKRFIRMLSYFRRFINRFRSHGLQILLFSKLVILIANANVYKEVYKSHFVCVSNADFH